MKDTGDRDRPPWGTDGSGRRPSISDGTTDTAKFPVERLGTAIEDQPETFRIEGENIGPDTWFGSGTDPTDREARLMKKYVLLKDGGDFRCKIPGKDHQLWSDADILRWLEPDNIPGMGEKASGWFPCDIDRIDGNHRHREGRNLRRACHSDNSIYANTAQRRLKEAKASEAATVVSVTTPTDKRILELSRGYEVAGRRFVFELVLQAKKTEKPAPDPDRARVKMRNEVGCLVPGQLIIGNPSVTAIEAVGIGTRVLGTDGFYGEVADTMTRSYSGQVVEIQPSIFRVPTIVTPEHPVLVARTDKPKRHSGTQSIRHRKLCWIEAGDLKKDYDLLAYPVPLKVVDATYVSLQEFSSAKSGTLKWTVYQRKKLPATLPINDDLLTFLGYYLAEGYVKSDKDVSLTFNIDEQTYADFVQSFVSSIGLSAAIHRDEKKHSLTVDFGSRVFGRFLEREFGRLSENKHVPDWIFYLPPAKQKILIMALFRGDGYYDKTRKRWYYATVSRLLAEQVKLMLLRLGIIPFYRIRPPVNGNSTIYGIEVQDGRFSGGQPRTHRGKYGWMAAGYALIPIKAVRRHDYSGPVHNLRVNDTESYCTSSATLHNCSRATSYGIMERLVGDKDDSTFPLWIETDEKTGAVGLRFHNANCYNMRAEQVTALYPARGYISQRGTTFE